MSTRSVPDGVDLLRFLSEVEADPDAWVQAVGYVDGVELAVPKGTEETTVALSGRVALVSLGGPLRGPFFALVAVAGETDARLAGGRLVRARSAGVTLITSSAEEAAPDTARDEAVMAAAGRSLPPAEAWAGAAAASRARDQQEREEEEESDEAPAYGDRVDHFVFGLCEVMVVHGERMKIRDLGASGKLRELHLRAVRVLKPVVTDGKRVFKLLRKS